MGKECGEVGHDVRDVLQPSDNEGLTVIGKVLHPVPSEAAFNRVAEEPPPFDADRENLGLVVKRQGR